MTKIEKTVKEISDLYEFYTKIKRARAANKPKKGIPVGSTEARGARASD